ncbi:MAG TPA: DUF4258 domain-containing protein [Niastella sp.]|nr:DUF4258 domain-containing protein [Niastella sp.]
MRSRNVIFTLVILVGIFLFAIFRKWQEPQRREAFNRAPARLYYYAFALCRMQCLQVQKEDIVTIMKAGIININKSNRAFRPCPTFAVQARSRNKYMRVIFEQCRNGTYVVNCYNLQSDTACNCSAEYKSNQK